MDMLEYNEAVWPTRALQQEEEEQAVPLAAAQLAPPAVEWQAGVQPPAPLQLLVVAMSAATSALLDAALAEAQAVGHVKLAAAASPAAPSGSAKPAQPAALYAPQPGVLVCSCGATVPAEQAPAWARGVLQALEPQRVLLLGSMQAEQYRGEADASQELLAFVLQTTAARQQQEQAGGAPLAPYLPSGSLVSGLPAALLSQAQLCGLPGELLVSVEQVPALVPETLAQLAGLVAGALRAAAGGGAGPLARVGEACVVDAARARLRATTFRPSSVYS